MRRLIYSILVLVQLASQGIAQELEDFFPSVPIHEDDRFSETFQIETNRCEITLTETFRKLRTITRANLKSYETNPERMRRPFAKQLSTRYFVGWLARTHEVTPELEAINQTLQSLRISLFDIAKVSSDELKQRSKLLEEQLVEITDGTFGRFAKENYTARYYGRDDPILLSIWINTFFRLPVQSKEIPALAQSVNRFASACSR